MIKVGPFAIMGDWDPSPEPADRLVIRLVPQQVNFGFANAWKPSSQAFLRNMDSLVRPGDTVIDIGTGTGLLAIAAVRLGASSVIAVEPLDVSIGYAIRNFAANGVESSIDLRAGWYPMETNPDHRWSRDFKSVYTEGAIATPLPRADVVLCNVDLFECLQTVLKDHLAPKVAMMPDTREFALFDALATATGYQIVQSELVPTYSDTCNYVVVEEV